MKTLEFREVKWSADGHILKLQSWEANQQSGDANQICLTLKADFFPLFKENLRLLIHATTVNKVFIS